MKKINVYEVYLEDNSGVSKIHVPAFTKKEAEQYVSGNGEIIAVKKLSDKYQIVTEGLSKALKNDDWNDREIEVLTRLIRMVGLGD